MHMQRQQTSTEEDLHASDKQNAIDHFNKHIRDSKCITKCAV